MEQPRTLEQRFHSRHGNGSSLGAAWVQMGDRSLHLADRGREEDG
ncbi:hypothetical protein [Paenibacillus alvei]|nr:hypothetical protein [Paenibacillus alvei]